MTEEWADRLLALLEDPDLSPRAVHKQFEDAKSALAIAHEKVEKLERLLVARAERNAATVGRLMTMRDDPVVLVRAYGSPQVYHSFTTPCGWVAEADSYDRLLLQEALERRLQPCHSCGSSVPENRSTVLGGTVDRGTGVA